MEQHKLHEGSGFNHRGTILSNTSIPEQHKLHEVLFLLWQIVLIPLISIPEF